MNVEQIREYCLRKKGVTEDFPFDDVCLVIRVKNKMFILIPLDTPDRISLKCDPELAIELREKHPNVKPGYHFNKKYWNSVYFEGGSEELLYEWIDHSYDEVVKKLTKKAQRELLEEE